MHKTYNQASKHGKHKTTAQWHGIILQPLNPRPHQDHPQCFMVRSMPFPQFPDPTVRLGMATPSTPFHIPPDWCIWTKAIPGLWLWTTEGRVPTFLYETFFFAPLWCCFFSFHMSLKDLRYANFFSRSSCCSLSTLWSWWSRTSTAPSVSITSAVLERFFVYSTNIWWTTSDV